MFVSEAWVEPNGTGEKLPLNVFRALEEMYLALYQFIKFFGCHMYFFCFQVFFCYQASSDQGGQSDKMVYSFLAR